MNGDGNITEAEYCLDSPEIVFIRKDENGDGKLKFNEYSIWSGTPEKRAQAKAEFDRRDIDKDELLTFREYMQRAEEIDFWAFDGDDDHRLSLEEFCLSPTLVAGVSGNAPVDALTDLSEFPAGWNCLAKALRGQSTQMVTDSCHSMNSEGSP